MPLEITQDIIDQYLNKQLQGELLIEFESKMKMDEEFKKEIESQAFLHRGIQKFGEDEMRAKLKKIRASIQNEETKGKEVKRAKVVGMTGQNRPRPILRWSMAATIALAIGASIYFFATMQNVSSADLYASYYEPYAQEINVRNASAESKLNQAAQLYSTKAYGQALPIFLELINVEPDNAELQLVIGICHLESNNFEKATQIFSALDNPLYRDQAQWYLAMTFLKQSDVENARTVLESIKSGDYNYTQAQEILQTI